MRRILCCCGIAVLLAGGVLRAQGSEPQIVVAPPPLAYPDYAEGRQGRFGLQYINVKVADYELDGVGLNVTQRTPRLDEDGMGRALSFGYGLAYLTGGNANTDVDSAALGLQLNLEREVSKSGSANTVLFGGGNFAYTRANVSLDGVGFDSDTAVEGLLLGFQVGGQYTVRLSGVELSPYLVYIRQKGRADADTDVYIYSPCCSNTSSRSSTDVSVTTTIIGFDMLHVGSGMTLSGLLQQARSDDSDVDTKVVQLSWAFGEGVSAAKENPLGVDLKQN